MEISLSYYPQVFLMVLARVGGVMGMVPFYGGPTLPPRIRAMAMFVVTLAIMPMVPAGWAASAQELNTGLEIVFAMLGELLLGVAVGLVCNAFLGTGLVAGQVVSLNSGLMRAKSINPVGGVSSPVMSQIIQMTFVVVLLAFNAHLVILKLLGESFVTAPEAVWWGRQGFLDLVIQLGVAMFEWGIKIAMPVICMGFVINVCLALISRLAQDFNVLFLALPVRLLAGMLVFGLALRFGKGIFETIITEMVHTSGRVLGV